MKTRIVGRCSTVLIGLGLITVAFVAAAGAGEIADLHRKWVKPKALDPVPLLARFERFNEPRHGVTEIGLERTLCFGTCPAYVVILKSDGTFSYTGEENVRRKGTHTGKFSEWSFNQLAEYLVDIGYMDLESNYEVPVTDLPTAYTTAVINGKRKIIRNYGDVGPTRLWALQQAVDGILSEAEWDDEPKRNAAPKTDGKP